MNVNSKEEIKGRKDWREKGIKGKKEEVMKKGRMGGGEEEGRGKGR